ncbi:hypothetical protein [Rhodophyticola porphyridii]|uniref:hypothetical protein n=1 Tax=Rhodophyticola porphyridii TaxID=1852017 RepID=UPI0035CF1974
MTYPSDNRRICGVLSNSGKIKMGIEKYPSPTWEMKMKDEFNTTGLDDHDGKELLPTRNILAVDVERYQAYLDDQNMPQAQKAELLQALWSIMMFFVQIEYEVHPLQEVCGKPSTDGGGRAKDDFNEVSSEEPNLDENNKKMSP